MFFFRKFYRHKNKDFVQSEYLEFLLKNNLIIEGIKGGLVIGNSHDDNGINFIRAYNDYEYYVSHEIEGFEYLMGVYPTNSHLSKLEKINNYCPDIPFLD